MRHVFSFIGVRADDGFWTIEDGDEVEHARKVLRLQPGDLVDIFDGKGSFGRGSVEAISRDSIRVLETDCRREAPGSSKLKVALGALKPGELDEVLPALVELGVDEVLVFHQEGTERFRMSEKALNRWDRIVLGATKQAKRAWLTRVQTFESLDALVTATASSPAVRLVLQPTATRSLLAERLGAGQVIALLGGERGLTAGEENTLGLAGFLGVRIGGHILRARTAAVAAAAILSSRRDDASKGEVVDSR